MIVRCYDATFLPIMHLFCDVIVEKLKVQKYIQHVGYQHVRLSYSIKYEERQSLFSVI